MKNPILSMIPFLLFGFFSQAQPDTHRKRERDFEKIEAYKTKFITDKLDLSAEEAQKFWPVYNAYKKELDVLNHKRFNGMDRKDIREGWDKLSDDEIEVLAKQELQTQKDMADLKLRYFDQFKAVLGTRKAALYFRIEIEFHRRLMDQLGKRKKRP
jgi:hypothetical protein